MKQVIKRNNTEPDLCDLNGHLKAHLSSHYVQKQIHVSLCLCFHTSVMSSYHHMYCSVAMTLGKWSD